jgi:hypothetical protein
MIGAVPALAQQRVPGELVTDRPDQTESASIVPPGFVQIEAGWSLEHLTDGALRIRTHSVPGVLLRAGLTNRLEARIGFAGWQAADTAGLGGAASDVGDTEMGLKALLRSAEAGGPAVALIAHATLPTGSGAATSGKPDPSLLLSVAHDLSDRVALGWNLGPVWTSGGTPAARQTLVDLAATASLGISLTDRWSAFVETFGAVPLSEEAESVVSVDGGVTVRVGENLQLDASAGVAVLAAAANWFVASGLSIRLPR